MLNLTWGIWSIKGGLSIGYYKIIVHDLFLYRKEQNQAVRGTLLNGADHRSALATTGTCEQLSKFNFAQHTGCRRYISHAQVATCVANTSLIII